MEAQFSWYNFTLELRKCNWILFLQRFPKKFVREYGDKLSSIATLTVPNGSIWQVRLEKANNNIWVRGGWQDFVEHHSINYGYFLVFKYKGNSKFQVLVFDMTATEIKYPSNGDKKRQGNLNEIEMSTPQELWVKHEVDTELIVIENFPIYSIWGSVLSGEGERALQADRMFEPKNPSFIHVIQAYNLNKSFVVSLYCTRLALEVFEVTLKYAYLHFFFLV